VFSKLSFLERFVLERFVAGVATIRSQHATRTQRSVSAQQKYDYEVEQIREMEIEKEAAGRYHQAW